VLRTIGWFSQPTERTDMRNIRSILVTGGAIAAAAAGGAVVANAATSSTSSASSAAQPAQRMAPANMPAHGTASHEDAEKAVRGAAAAKAQAAAVKYLGGGTAGAVTTDFTGRGYEVTVTRPGGTKVEVHLDSSFAVMQRPGGPGAMPPSGPPGAWGG
jgi:hypothetical protein